MWKNKEINIRKNKKIKKSIKNYEKKKKYIIKKKME